MKYRFSTDFDTVSQNLGISQDRHELFFKEATSVALEAIFGVNELTERSQIMEMFLNKIQPKNDIEAFWAGYIYFDVFSQAEKIAEKMDRFLSKIIDEKK